MHARASLGLSAVGYQWAAIASAPRSAVRGTLIRQDSNTSKGREASRNRLLDRRAALWYCPCCVVATHVDYTSGFHDALEDQGAALWKSPGPREPRRLAALRY